MVSTSGIWIYDVSYRQCLYQGGSISGIAGGKQLQVTESWWDDIGDGEVDCYRIREMASMEVVRFPCWPFILERQSSSGGRMNKKNQSIIRVCARCEYVYLGHRGCPKCKFAHYGAVYVYGSWLGAILALMLQSGYRRRKK